MKTSLSYFLIAWSALSAFSAYATNYKDEVDHRLADLVTIKSTTANESESPACYRRYQNLYKDGTLNVSIGFGYWDGSPNEFVYDHYIANGLRLALVAPCSPGVNVCGFTRNGDLYTKKVKGPDGKPNTFSLSITYGSLTEDNLQNTTTLKDKQNNFCQQATDKFFNEISSGPEVVMYLGHARDGGGPDFCPPVRTPNKHVNYPWYRKNQPGFKKLLSALDSARASGKPNQVVGLYSCFSRDHFHKKMSLKNPDTGFILTNAEIYSPDALNSLATTLDALLEKKCAKGFVDGMKLSPNISLYGMFSK